MKTLILVLILMIFPFHRGEEAIYEGNEFEEEYLIELEEVTIHGSRYDRIYDLDELDSIFRLKVDSFLLDCKAQGIDLMVFETFRTHQRQDLMKKRGKSKLSGGYSKHQHGKAIDIVPLINGKPRWKGVPKAWNRIFKVARKYDFTLGADWRMKDFPHLELKE